MKKKCVIKRRGHEDNYDERKIYGSCYAACLSTEMKHTDAEKICEKISKEITKHVNNKFAKVQIYYFAKPTFS